MTILKEILLSFLWGLPVMLVGAVIVLSILYAQEYAFIALAILVSIMLGSAIRGDLGK